MEIRHNFLENFIQTLISRGMDQVESILKTRDLLDWAQANLVKLYALMLIPPISKQQLDETFLTLMRLVAKSVPITAFRFAGDTQSFHLGV